MTAMVGAALKGPTLHSLSRTGRGVGTAMQIEIVKNMHPGANHRWQDVQCIIVEEVSMLSAQLTETLREIGRIMRDATAWFWGIRLILVGHSWQSPPTGTYVPVRDPDSLLQSAKYRAEPADFCVQSTEWAQGQLQLYLLTYTWRYGEDNKLHNLRERVQSAKCIDNSLLDMLLERQRDTFPEGPGTVSLCATRG